VKMQLRKTKTDKKDAVVIAQFSLTMGLPWFSGTPSLDFGSSDLSRQRETLVDEMTSLKIEIKQLLISPSRVGACGRDIYGSLS